MARAEKDEQRLKQWKSKMEAAGETYEQWDSDFPGDLMEDLYTSLGQWPDETKRFERLFYNGTAANIESLKPQFGLQAIRVNLTPNPSKVDDDLSAIEGLIPDLEAAANTIVKDRDTGFIPELNLAVHESFFRFGMLHCGYKAELVDNEKAGQSIKDADDNPVLKSDGTHELEPERVVTSELLWVKRVPAKCVRFAPTMEWMLSRIPWVAYWEWVAPKDIKANPRYSNTANIKPGGAVNGLSGEGEEDESKANKGKTLVWYAWDQVKKRHLVFADNATDGFLLEEDYEVFPLTLLRHFPILNTPYPKPFITDWIPLQMEANEVREWMRTHRRRARRRMLYRKGGTFDEAAIEAMQNGADMAMIGVEGDPSAVVFPAPDMPLDPATVRAVPATQADWDQIAQVPAEARNVSGAGSATQANLIAGSSRSRGDYLVGVINQFIGETVEVLLKLMIAHSALPMWVEMLTDPASPMAAQNQQKAAQSWQQLSSYDLLQRYPGAKDRFSWSVHVEIERSRPETTDLERDRFNGFLQQIANPIVGKMLALSPTLLRHALALYNIESSRQVAEVGRALQAMIGMEQQPPPNQTPGSGNPNPAGPGQRGGAPVKQTPGGPQPGSPSTGGAGRVGPAPAGQSATSRQIGG